MKLRQLLTLVALAAVTADAVSQDSFIYQASAVGNASTGDFAPYFIGSMNGGRIVRSSSALLDIGAKVDLDLSKRFSWAAGAEFITGYSAANSYDRWSEAQGSWTTSTNRPAAIWLQQLYAKVKYRGVVLRVGQEDAHSQLLDETLSSGDLTRSGNARGIPGVSLGFVNFQNIPFTNGWVQIAGSIEYGRFTDNGFSEKQFNYYNNLLVKDICFTYKYCYFRTKPTENFFVTLGMQTAGQFGGSTQAYRNGLMYREEIRGFHFKDLFKMFLPVQGNGDAFYEGNSLGSWDFKATYRLRTGDTVSFAFEWPWEDGSGIGRRNGWDGLWGLYYKAADTRRIVSGAALEYLDFRNQSGPIHWAPGDNPGTSMVNSATGGDNYYNNDTYAAYDNYGMAIATPFLVSPIYNLNGFPGFQHNCARGVHAAVTGYIGAGVDYTVKYSWQQAWGIGRTPQPYSRIDNSVLVSAGWDAANVLKGLKVSAAVSFDAGSLRGNNFGALVGVTYTGSVNFKKRAK